MAKGDWWLEGHDHECPLCGSVCDCEVGSEFGESDCVHDCDE